MRVITFDKAYPQEAMRSSMSGMNSEGYTRRAVDHFVGSPWGLFCRWKKLVRPHLACQLLLLHESFS